MELSREQIAEGSVSNLTRAGITSGVVLVNVASGPIQPALYYCDPEGDLEIQGDGSLTVRTEMASLGELAIATHGRGPLVSESVRVVSDGPVGGMYWSDHSGIGQTVVGPSPAVSDAIFPARCQEGGINTGVAIYNLESTAGLARCELMREGVLQDAVRIPLAANGQTSWMIDAAFTMADTSDFAGSAHCGTIGTGRFTAMALEIASTQPAQGQVDPPNQPLVVTGEGSIEYAENGEGAVSTYAADLEEDSITWSVSGTDGAAFFITAGVLGFHTPPNYENPTDQNGNNVYEVEVVATDSGGASGMIAVTITVTDVNDPNIVLIMADDVGYEAFGAYGSTQYVTPRIDELAASGVRFTNAFSKPRCTPSRVALMTGKSNVRNYVDFGVLLPGEYTITDLFREAGYATAIAGKWQLQGGPTTVTGVAAGTGFDTYLLWNTTNTESRRYWRPSIESDGSIVNTGEDDYGPDLFVDFLLDFIESNQEKPFFAYYPMVLPHSPFEPPRQAQCAGDDDEQCNFEDMVAYLDSNVGRIRDKLVDLELLDNTILVFTSDNGTHHKLVSDLGGEMIHGDKGATTDDGAHVPLIVHVPGGAGGQVLDDLIDFSDFLPTLADAADLTIPHRAELDGVSFWNRLQGGPGQPRKWIYTYYFPRPYVIGSFDTYAYPETSYARDKRYKLYGTGELFDVTVDRHELYPLPIDHVDSSAARTKLQAVLDSMPGRGAEIRSSEVSLSVSPLELRPRWRPVLSAAIVNGAELTLTYAGILDQAVQPTADSFTVEADGSERIVSTVSISAGAVTLTLASAETFGQTVTVSYTPGTRAIQHANRSTGHAAAALTREAVKNETPANQPPVAVADTAETTEDTPVSIDVLDNDTDHEDAPLSPTIGTPPTNGSAVVETDGTIT